jgi:hypothetical protein
MNLTRCHKHVDAVFVGTFDCGVNFFDVLPVAARKATDCRAEVCISNCPDRVEIARRRCRETGFDNIYAEIGKCPGDAKFFPQRHAAAGGLFAITQGGVEDRYPLICRLFLHWNFVP